MSELKIGYARVSTDAQDLAAQRDALEALGVEPERIYVDHGLTGTHRDRPGLRQALAACRARDTLVVTKLDRLAQPALLESRPDAGHHLRQRVVERLRSFGLADVAADHFYDLGVVVERLVDTCVLPATTASASAICSPAARALRRASQQP